jgi:hypothetical protein
MEVHQKTKNRIPEEYESSYNRDTCTPKFITALSTIAKPWNQPRCQTMGIIQLDDTRDHHVE